MMRKHDVYMKNDVHIKNDVYAKINIPGHRFEKHQKADDEICQKQAEHHQIYSFESMSFYGFYCRAPKNPKKVKVNFFVLKYRCLALFNIKQVKPSIKHREYTHKTTTRHRKFFGKVPSKRFK